MAHTVNNIRSEKDTAKRKRSCMSVANALKTSNVSSKTKQYNAISSLRTISSYTGQEPRLLGINFIIKNLKQSSLHLQKVERQAAFMGL